MTVYTYVTLILMTEPCFPSEKAALLKIQHGYHYKLSLSNFDCISAGWSVFLLNQCQMSEYVSVVIRGALFCYYQCTEGSLGHMKALPTVEKLMNQALLRQ